jgi:hypothetical protein
MSKNLTSGQKRYCAGMTKAVAAAGPRVLLMFCDSDMMWADGWTRVEVLECLERLFLQYLKWVKQKAANSRDVRTILKALDVVRVAKLMPQ